MQLAIDFLPVRFRSPEQPHSGSQCEQVLRHLQAGYTLTTLEAVEKFGVMALSQRCTDLRKLGWPIKSEPVVTANGKRIARYSLERLNELEAACASS